MTDFLPERVNDLCGSRDEPTVGAAAALAIDWRDISTAPSDGRMALVYRPLAAMSHDQPIAIKRLVGGNHHCWPATVPAGSEPTNPTDGSCHVTHWAPIVPPDGGEAVQGQVVQPIRDEQ